jgi:putative ABC transport system permease protein
MRKNDPVYPSGARRLFRLSRGRGSIERDIDDEIRFHMEERVDDLVRRGWDADAARDSAIREYGDVALSQRELAEVDRRRLARVQRREILMSTWDDLRYSARSLLRRPALMAISVSALTISIAANAVMFGVIDQLMLRPPSGVAAPDEVKRIYLSQHVGKETSTDPVASYPMISAIESGVPSLDVAAFDRLHTLGVGPDGRGVQVQIVSGNYFTVLGVVMAAGRAFTAAEDDPTKPTRVAVASDAYWRGELGEARDAIGRSVTIDGDRFTIIGIAPPGFSGIDRERTDMWVPASALAETRIGPHWRSNAGSYWMDAIGRLRHGATVELAESQGTAAVRNEIRAEKRPWADSLGTLVLGTLIGTRTPDGFSPESKVSLWLMGVAIIVLLIACANVANLLIARTIERRREIAVRLALGVSRGRLLRQLLSEAALLAGVAAIASMIVAQWASRFIEHTLLPGIVWTDSVLDTRVLAFTLGATVLCIFLAGAIPAAHGMSTDVSNGLKSSSRQIAGGRGGLRRGLLATQAALSFVLLVGAGLFVASLRNVVRRDVGIDFEHAMTVSMDLRRSGFSRPDIDATFRTALVRAVNVPGVMAASMVWTTVPGSSASAMGFSVPGRAKNPELVGGGPYYGGIGANFFSAIGARIVRGRDFTPSEERAPTRVMIINQMLADAYWPGANPIGQCVRLDSDSTCTEIVGVAQNIMLFRMIKDDRAMIYLPPFHPMLDGPPSAIIVRTAGDPSLVIPELRRTIQGVAPNMPFVSVRPYSEIVAPQLRPWRLGATMFTIFGAIALIIAAVGLYSVMAYSVSQRTHEIGVRVALGARTSDVVRLVTLQGLRAIGAGIVLGAAIALFASRWIADMLYNASAHDPRVYVGAAVVMAIAGGIASVVPARRSARVDPAITLRAD